MSPTLKFTCVPAWQAVMFKYRLLPCRLRWDNPQGGYFEELQGPEASILPNGLAWDQQRFYHADTGHRTIIEYPTDRDGIPLPSPSRESISGRVVVTVPESDGEHLGLSLCITELNSFNPSASVFKGLRERSFL